MIYCAGLELHALLSPMGTRYALGTLYNAKDCTFTAVVVFAIQACCLLPTQPAYTIAGMRNTIVYDKRQVDKTQNSKYTHFRIFRNVEFSSTEI